MRAYSGQFHDLWLDSRERVSRAGTIRSHHVHDLVALAVHDRWCVNMLVKSLDDRAFAERVVTQERDVFTTLAATGGFRLLAPIARQLQRWFPRGTDIDAELMIDTALKNDDSELVAWLQNPHNTLFTTKSSYATMLRGARSKPRLVPIVNTDSSNTQSRLSSAEDRLSRLSMHVLTHRSLMSQIGAFQETRDQTFVRVMHVMEQMGRMHSRQDGSVGWYVHVVIVLNKIKTLKELYSLSRSKLEPRVHVWLSFEYAMHFAAGEGRLEILKWLHTQRASKCRPDTMAKAVRCGHALVVEWLHLICPESGLTMSEFAFNDAVRSGHKDVIRMCLQYNLPGATSSALDFAIEATDLDMLRIIATSRTDLISDDFIDHAIRTGQVGVLQVLYEACGFEIDAERLAFALTAAEDVVAFFLSVVDLSSDAVRLCAQNFFDVVLANGTRAGLNLLLASVSLRTGDRAMLQSLPDKLKQWQGEATSSELNRIKPRCSIDGLVQLFDGVACDKTRKELARIFVTEKLDMLVDGALPFIAQFDLEAVELMYHRRTKEDAVRALREATDESVVRFLLSHEDQFYTRRIILANAPRCMAPAIVRVLCAEDSDDDLQDQVIDWKGASLENNSLLSVRELSKAVVLDMEDFVLRHRDVLIHSKLWLDALAYDDNLRAFSFLYCKAGVIDTDGCEPAVLVKALCSAVRMTFFAFGLIRSVPTKAVAAILDLVGRQPEAILEQVFASLMSDLNGLPLKYVDKALEAKECLGPLFVKALSRLRRRHRQQLLLRAAQAGEKEIVCAVLQGPSDVAGAPTDLKIVDAMMVAVRYGHHVLVPLIHARRATDEVVTVAAIRDRYQWREPDAVHVLLSLLEPVDPSISAALASKRTLDDNFLRVPSVSQPVSKMPRQQSGRGRSQATRRLDRSGGSDCSSTE